MRCVSESKNLSTSKQISCWVWDLPWRVLIVREQFYSSLATLVGMNYPSTSDKILRLPEMIHLTGLKRSTIYQLIAKEKLRPVRK
jgi:hypothetical protein